MRNLSLRARLLLVLALALAPAVALATMRVAKGMLETHAAQSATAATVAELAVSRHREVIDGARRLAFSLSEGRFLASWAEENGVEPADYAAECHVRLERIRSRFAQEFASIALIDEEGKVRCANAASARGADMAASEVFERVRERQGFAVGKYARTPLGPASVIPAGVPIVRDGRFRGVVVVGISLEWFVELGLSGNTPLPLRMAVVDDGGAPVAAASADDQALPPRATLARMIADKRMDFRERSVGGELHDYHIAPFGAGSLLAVVAVPASAQPGGFMSLWVELGAVFLTSALALFALWTAADMWCLRPLKPVRAAAAAIARGEYGQPKPAQVSTPEMQALSDDVFAIAEAIRRREDDLKSGLKQREQMLREIHHRVKNNLQMISSLLSLQADTIRSPRVRRFFRAAQNRVLTLSILHRHLYERSNWSSVDFQAFISDLVRHLSAEQGRAGGAAVRFDVKAPVMEVGPDSAIPAGLIVTEAVSNALNHAFAGVESPEVRITAIQDGSEVELTIEDNGVGVSDVAAGLDDRPGLGFTLMRGLSAQLGGQADISAREGGGTVVRVRFPSPELADDKFPMPKG